MLKQAIHKMEVLPVDKSFKNDKGEKIISFETTLLKPVVHKLNASTLGSMPQAQIQAVFAECAAKSQEVEIEYSEEGRDRNGNVKYAVYSVKPIPKKLP